ncbi:MAG: fumarylacetoacetate hydrolase family protein [Chloroflexi bacterium]|nr:fumarylacetoacetate hydrolase family protein [Chloroflexota bacterium]
MKLVSFKVGGQVRHGVLLGAEGAEQVRDLGSGDLLALVEGGAEALQAARNAAGPERALADVQLVAPIRRPPKLLALAANYQDHITESGAPRVDKDRIVPKLFLKPSSAIIGPGETLCLPTVSQTTDWELELAVVIGSRCRNVTTERALDHVFGYTIANDVSARTVEWGVERDENTWNEFFDWLNGKWPDGFAPLGPYVLTADEVPNPQALEMRLTVNGEQKQHASTREMIFGVAEAIAFASRFMTLEPGDIIETGTPSGVGAATGTYVKEGDVMEGWIEKLGTLRTPVGPPTSS